MISKFITVPKQLHLLKRCAFVANYSTKLEYPKKPQKSLRIDSLLKDESRSARSNVRSGLSKYGKETLKKPLPEYPKIEAIRTLELETFLPSNFRTVKYGEFEFTECKEGYVQVHVKGWTNDRDKSNVVSGYGVCYGKENHPLNACGRVVGKQADSHASMYATAEALKSLPKDLFTKVCICTDSIYVVRAMSELLPRWAENGYRRLDETTPIQNLATVKFLNEFVRLNPFTYRFKYTPSDCYITMMTIAVKLAKKGCMQ